LKATGGNFSGLPLRPKTSALGLGIAGWKSAPPETSTSRDDGSVRKDATLVLVDGRASGALLLAADRHGKVGFGV
jgi:hypothetical protein